MQILQESMGPRKIRKTDDETWRMQVGSWWSTPRGSFQVLLSCDWVVALSSHQSK